MLPPYGLQRRGRGRRPDGDELLVQMQLFGERLAQDVVVVGEEDLLFRHRLPVSPSAACAACRTMHPSTAAAPRSRTTGPGGHAVGRTEESRMGKACVIPVRAGWSTYH